MRRSGFAFLSWMLFLALPSCAQNRPDFSGTWAMDSSRSESAHQDVPIGSVSLVIRQTAGELSVETRRTEKDASAVSTETLSFKLDGTETENTGTSGAPIRVKAHWNGSKLVAETAREMNGSTVTTLQVFQLGAKGKELTIHKTLTVQHGYQGVGAQRSTGSGTDVFIKTSANKGSGARIVRQGSPLG